MNRIKKFKHQGDQTVLVFFNLSYCPQNSGRNLDVNKNKHLLVNYLIRIIHPMFAVLSKQRREDKFSNILILI